MLIKTDFSEKGLALEGLNSVRYIEFVVLFLFYR